MQWYVCSRNNEYDVIAVNPDMDPLHGRGSWNLLYGPFDTSDEAYARADLAANEVTNLSGKSINFQAAVNLMADDIREDLHNGEDLLTNQDFFTAYERAHLAKFGEEWELSKANPVW